MIFHKSNAIVIGGIKYSETSKIIKLYTEQFGKVSLVAKGARRKKSDFRGVLENFNHIEAVYIPGKKDLHTLAECYLFEDFFLLKQSIPRIAVAYRLAALINETQAAEDPHPEIFALMLQTLHQLNHRKNYQPLSTAFQLQLLQLSGFFPQIESCPVCGRTLGHSAKGGAVFYQQNQSQFTCGRKECVPGGNCMKISAGSFEIIRKLGHTPVDRTHTFRLSRAQLNEIEVLLKRMFEYALDRKPRAMDVIDKLSSYSSRTKAKN